MKDRAKGLEKIATADHTQELPPGTATRMAIGAEIPPSHSAAIGTVRVRAEMVGGVDLTPAPARHDDAWGRSGGGLRAGSGGVRTGVAVWLFDEAFKGFRRTVALRAWGWRGQGCRARGGGARPHPLEHDAQPYENDQRELVEEKRRDHGKTPSYTG